MKHFKTFLMSAILVMMVLGGWQVAYAHGCYAVLLFFLFWGTIATSFIDIKMHERRCVRRCYLQPHTLLARLLVSPVAVSLFYLAVSFMMAISAFVTIIDFSSGLWLYLPIHTLVVLILYRQFVYLFRSRIKEEYLALFAREWSINVSALLLIGTVFFLAYEGEVPIYLSSGLDETIRTATNSVNSVCSVSDAILRFYKEVEAVTWWLMREESAVVGSGLLRTAGWMLFLLYNSLAVLGINRFVAEVIYRIDRRGRDDGQRAGGFWTSFFSWKAMGRGEKYFWGTILLFLVPFTILTVAAIVNMRERHRPEERKEPIVTVQISQILKRNIEMSRADIVRDLYRKESELNTTVEREIDAVFEEVYANVDPFLDYHYSIVGEYSELRHAASNDIERIVSEKLFGEEFEPRFQKALRTIGSALETAMKAHSRSVEANATAGVDWHLNEKILEAIKRDIAKNISVTAATFVGVVGSAKVVSRLIPKITAKFLSKVGTKLAAKMSAKTAGKVAAAETGAVSGVLCGPYVWICSPVLAAAAWFTTDAIVIEADEMLTRDSFRKDIIEALDEEKKQIEQELKRQLAGQLETFSLAIRKRYESQPLKVKEIIYDKTSE
ncbi:hypothetical protein [Hydrogenimonas sp.]|uniref:hypothetical protein n=1 Tax=Hydrogenimonas sp. TaxID=2231112 RepID=UPI0026278BDC|nr:hypothetical protein [Hydrogenimonas sp.]